MAYQRTPSGSLKGVAIFDLDGTLIRRDSLLPFIVGMVGWPRALYTLALSALFPASGQMDTKTAIKAAWLRRTLKGQSETRAKEVAKQVQLWRDWLAPQKQALEKHHADGLVVIVATGALSLYVREVLAGLPVDEIIATEMEVKEGALTGEMQGGNNVRAEKARRVKAWLKTHGPVDVSYGYGNAPSDLPFLELMDYKTII